MPFFLINIKFLSEKFKNSKVLSLNMDIDQTNVKLLRALRDDARRSLREIAKELGVSTVTVINRMKNLRGEGVIKGFSAHIDPKKVGFELTAVISLKAKGKMLLPVQEKIAKDPHVCGVYDVTGDFDSVIVARFKNVNDLNNFIKKTLALEGIDRTYTQVALNVIKEDFGVNL